MLMWEDSQASSGFGGIIVRNENGNVYTNDPYGFGRINPTIDNELEVRREGAVWTVYLDGVQIGSPITSSSTRTATKVQIWTNKYRFYNYRDAQIDYIQISVPMPHQSQMLAMTKVSNARQLPVLPSRWTAAAPAILTTIGLRIPGPAHFLKGAELFPAFRQR